jgi:hypothetical protein
MYTKTLANIFKQTFGYVLFAFSVHSAVRTTDQQQFFLNKASEFMYFCVLCYLLQSQRQHTRSLPMFAVGWVISTGFEP